MEIITSENVDKILKNNLVVIQYTAKWCKLCKDMDKEMKHLEKQFPAITFGKVDIDKEKEIAFKHIIPSLPSVLVFKKGEEIERFLDVPEDVLAMELSMRLGELI